MADAIAIERPRARPSRPGGVLGLVAILFALLPWRVALWSGALIGFFAGTVLRIRRHQVEDRMRRAGISVDDKRVFGAQMYRSLGASLAELLWLAGRGRWAHPSRLAQFDEQSEKKLERAIARGRGVVLATGHTGNWELAAAAIAERWPMAIVAKPMSVGMVDRFIRRAREGRGMEVIAPRGAMARAKRAMKRGAIVGMMIDQVPDRLRHSIEIDFLCGYCDVDRSPFALAAAMRAPVVVAGAWRDEDGRHVLEVITVLEPPAHGRRAWVDEAARQATKALDKFVHRHPHEWLWLHRRWKKAPK